MVPIVVRDDFTPAYTQNVDIHRLYEIWRKARTGDAIPSLSSFDIDTFWCSGDLMLVERNSGNSFKYLRYGRNIALPSGFDMTGKLTSDFDSDIGQFFESCYRRCVEEKRVLYTTHPAVHVALVTGWERLLLPLSDDNAAVNTVLVYNRPLAFKHELLAHVLDATRDIIMSFEPVIGEKDMEADFIVLSLNRAAEGFLDCRRVDAVGHYLSTLNAHWRSTNWGRALIDSLQRGIVIEQEWNREEGQGACWYRMVVNPLKEAVVITLSDITQLKVRESSLKRLNQNLETLASTDPLTGVSNRRYFIAAAEEELERSRRYALPLSVMVFDLDWFKRINDNYGHAAGDRVLVETVRLIQERLRTNDIIARIGGDEFAIILPNTEAVKAQELSQRLCTDLAARKIDVGTESVAITCSFGVSQFSPDNNDVYDLIQEADQALYRAKQMGRNRVELGGTGFTDRGVIE